ncbi:hypothetical protein LSCM1_02951 [Leishmania martiniquensis]|uniref:Uncharacterized protein n=1 Tax=Leishmania martiniquensis TaxID=1580590 RepID=A0A836H401_9TRYP|nr:hypothetical protein LSCM1_02951 [Leishmania martiniquensis]
MGFDALINTFCWTCLVLLGLWVIADVVQALELLILMRAYKRNEKNVFAIPFAQLLTRLFHELAVPQFLASEAIQRGELPPAVMANGRQTPAAVPVEYVGPGATPPSPGTVAVTSAFLASLPLSASDEVLGELPTDILTGSLRGGAGKAKKEGRLNRAGNGVDHEKGQHHPGQQRRGTVAVVTVEPTHAAADGSALTPSPDPAWWKPRLQGQCLVLGLHLPLELLPATPTATQANACKEADACGAVSRSGTGTPPRSGNDSTTRQPTVNLQLRQYQLVPSAAAPSLALRQHRMMGSDAGRQVRVAIAQQLSAAPLQVYTRAKLTRARVRALLAPSPLTRTPPQHTDFDAVKSAYTQHCQRLLAAAVAEQTTMAQRMRHDRKSGKRAQRITARLMHYLQYAYMDNDAAANVHEGVTQDGAGGRGGGGDGAKAGIPRATAGMRKAATTQCATAGRTDFAQRSCAPWIPVIMSSACKHNDEYGSVGRDVSLSSSALLDHSLCHAAAPLPPAQSALPQQSFLQSRSSSSPIHSPKAVVVPPQHPPTHESCRGSRKRRRGAEAMPDATDRAIEALEGLLERVRLAQALRPRYKSLICSVRFSAERFVVRRGATETPTWTPLHTDAAPHAVVRSMARGVKSSSATEGRGVATRASCEPSPSSTSSLSSQQPHLRRWHGSTKKSSAAPAWLRVATRDAPASAFEAQGSRSKLRHLRGSANDRDSPGNRSACASAPLSWPISSNLVDGQVAADARCFSHECRLASAAAAPAGSCTHDESPSYALDRDQSDPLPPAQTPSSLRPHSVNLAFAQPPLPNALSSAPAHASVEIVTPLALPPASTPSTSAANAATEFLRESHLREKNKQSGIAAGVGDSFHSAAAPLADSAASRQLQEELRSLASSSEEALQSAAAAVAAPSPPRICASAPPVSLQPRSTDLRLVYVIGADRATLLRSLTVGATRSFAAGAQNVLCFFTRRDERRARRRYMEQLDRQNRAELQCAARSDTLAGASPPRRQRGSNAGSIDCVCSSTVTPFYNQAEERRVSTDDGALGEVLGNAGAVRQQSFVKSKAMGFVDLAGADRSTPAAMPTNSASATFTMSSAHRRESSSFSTLHSLDSGVCSIREPPHALHAAPRSGGGSPSCLTIIPSPSTVQLAKAPAEATRPPHPAAIIASSSKAGDKELIDVSAAAMATATSTGAGSHVQPVCVAIPPAEPPLPAAAGAHRHVDAAALVADPVAGAAPPSVAASAFTISVEPSAKRGRMATRKGAAASAADTAVVSEPVLPLPSPALPVFTDSVSAHDVRQYLSAVGVTLPEQVYLLLDAGALVMQRSLAPTQHSRTESSVRNTGSDTPAVTIPRTVGGAAKHNCASPFASAAAALCRGATRVLEGQVEVAELSLDVLSRQISPFLSLVPPPLRVGSSHEADYDGASVSHSRSTVASDDNDDNDGKVVVPLDAAAAKRPGKASLSPRSHSRQRHRRDSGSKDHGLSSACASHEQRHREHERRLKRSLARWKRHIQRRQAAAIKAGSIPVAVGALFFTAPPALPAELVQQQQRSLAQLDGSEPARLLVPEWALSGSEVVERAPVALEEARREGLHASGLSPHGRKPPPPRICMTLIYTATAEQVAQAVMRAAEVAAAAAAAALTDKSAAYDAVDPPHPRNMAVAHPRGTRFPAVAAAPGRERRSSCASYELVSSNADSGGHPSTPRQRRRRRSTVVMERSTRGRREPSSTSTALPSNENSLYYSFFSESLTPQPSRSGRDFVSGEHHHPRCQSSDAPPTQDHHPASPLNSCSETAAFSEEDRMEGTGDVEDGGTAASDAVSADSALMRVHGRSPSFLLFTESSESTHDGREGSSGIGGSTAEAGGRWGVCGRGAAGAGVVRTATLAYAEDLERSSSTTAHFARTKSAGDTVAWAGSPPSSTGDVRVGKALSKSVCVELAEAGRCEGDDVGAADEVIKVLRDSACFPEGVPVGVSLAYVRIGNDLYAITEVVDRSFLQYREERVMQPHPSRRDVGARRASDDDGDSSTSLSDRCDVAGEESELYSSSITNSSFASHTSFETLGAALESIRSQQQAAARQQRNRLRHRCRAVSTNDFGGLSYSLCGSAPLRSGMRRQEVHMCWRCLSAEAVVIFVPCGHYAVCDVCAELLADCCVCRTPILSSVVLLERS